MITQELINYIKFERSKGVTDEAIRQALQNVNWAASDIEQAFELVNKKTDEVRLDAHPRPKLKSKRFEGIKIIFYILFVILVFAAVTTYYVFSQTDIIPNYSLKKLNNLKSFDANINLELELDRDNLEAIESPLGLTENYLPKGKYSILYSGSLDLDKNINMHQVEIKTDEKNLGKYEVVLTKDSGFIKIDNSKIAKDYGLGDLEGKWLKVTPENMKDLFDESLTLNSFIISKDGAALAYSYFLDPELLHIGNLKTDGIFKDENFTYAINISKEKILEIIDSFGLLNNYDQNVPSSLFEIQDGEFKISKTNMSPESVKIPFKYRSNPDSDYRSGVIEFKLSNLNNAKVTLPNDATTIDALILGMPKQNEIQKIFFPEPNFQSPIDPGYAD